MRPSPARPAGPRGLRGQTRADFIPHTWYNHAVRVMNLHHPNQLISESPMMTISRKLLIAIVIAVCIACGCITTLWFKERNRRMSLDGRRLREIAFVKRFCQSEFSIKPSAHVRFYQEGLPVETIDFHYQGPGFEQGGGSVSDRYYYRCGSFLLGMAERNESDSDDSNVNVPREVIDSLLDQLLHQEPAFALKTINSVSPNFCVGQISHPAGMISIACSRLDNRRQQYGIVVSFSAFSSVAHDMILEVRKNGATLTGPRGPLIR
ncbi:MAG: hypothetical protein JWN40_3228 [Phycisphaerales bacterium]|nr:hypothetical protein [Phycisphaerales bacterium]